MADQADNPFPTPTGPDPGQEGPPPAAADLDALLNAVPCVDFGEDKVHRMMQKVRFRLIVDRLRVRDQAAVELIDFLRAAGAAAWKTPVPPPVVPDPGREALLAAVNSPPARDAARKLNPRLLSIPRDPQNSLAPPCLPSGKQRPERAGWRWPAGRRHLTAAGVALALNVGLILGLGTLVRPENSTPSPDQGAWESALRARKAADRRADENLAFVGRVIRQVCGTASNGFIPAAPRLLNARDRTQLEQALGTCREIIARTADVDVHHKEAGQARYWVGCILLLLGQPEEARAAYVQAIPQLKNLAEQFPDEPAYQAVMAETYLNLGTLLAQTGQPPAEAENAYSEAVAGYTRLAEKYPDHPDYQFQLADSHKQRGTFYRTTDRPKQAEREFHETLRLLSDLDRLRQALPDKYRLNQAESHWNLGKLHRLAGQYAEAMTAYVKAQAILTQLAGEVPNLAEYRIFLAGEFIDLGDQWVADGRLAQARPAYEQARDLCAGVVKEHPGKPDYLYQYAAALLQLALLTREQGDLNGACRLLGRAADTAQAARAVEPKSLAHLRTLHDTYLALAATQARRGDYRAAAAAAARLPELYPDRWQEHFRAVHFLTICLKMAEQDRQRPSEDRQRLTADYADRIGRHLRALDGVADDDPAAGNALAWLLATGPRAEWRNAPRALELAKKATKHDPNKSTFWNTRGVAHYRMGQWQDAVDALRRSMKLRNAGDGADWYFLAMAHWQLGDRQEARKWYQQALEWTRIHKPRDEELGRFRAEVAELIGPPDALTRSGPSGHGE